MRRRYPPLYSLTETEKNCIEFIDSIDINNYSIKGKVNNNKQMPFGLDGNIGGNNVFRPNQIAYKNDEELELETKKDMV